MFTVLDLFSGIGGFSLAAQWAGGKTIAFAETSTYASEVLVHHWPHIPNLGDVTKLCRRIYDCEPTESDDVWCPRCDAEFGECGCIGTDEFTDTYGFPDVITAGVPCQPTSLVGKRSGASDERWLWPDTLRIISELRPRFAILENPRAILTLENGNSFRQILGTFTEIGYDVQWEVVPAFAVGAGHRRERVWILASDANSEGLEGHARNVKAIGKEKENRYPPASDLRTRTIDGRLWYRQSQIEPVVNGIPGRLARNRLTAIGNAIVPQVAFIWLVTISEFFQGQR